MTTPHIVLWVYIVLLIAGGLVGFLKAGSKASIIASSAFALPLVLSAVGLFGGPTGLFAKMTLGLQLCYFGYRFWIGRKFMPNGLMAILSAGTLVMLYVFGGV